METTKKGVQMIEILAAPDKSYMEFFPGDWIVFGSLISIVWAIKHGCGYTDDNQ